MRYRVLDLPSKGVGAFTPTTSTNPTASSFGTVKRTALMGLVPLPVDSPKDQWGQPPLGANLKTQGSNVSPNVILRDQYVAYADNMGPGQHFGMAIRRLCPLPVPAVAAIRVPGTAMRSAKTGGRRAVPWPRAFQRFNSGGVNG